MRLVLDHVRLTRGSFQSMLAAADMFCELGSRIGRDMELPICFLHDSPGALPCFASTCLFPDLVPIAGLTILNSNAIPPIFFPDHN